MSVFFNIAGAIKKQGLGVVVDPPPPTGEKITLLQDHSYSWWVYPRTVYKNGINYWTSIGFDNNAYMHKFDGTTVTSVQVRTYSTRDEHNAPAFLLRDNDILMIMHPRNNSDFYIRTLSYDFQTLGSITNITTGGANLYTANYANVMTWNGRVFIFCRDDGNYWSVTWSDNLTTWANRVRLVYDSSEKVYMNGVQDGNKLVFGGYTHPNKGATNYLWSIEINADTGDVTHKGNTLGNIYGTYTTVPTANLDPLFSPVLGKVRFLDIAFSQDKQTVYALCADIQSNNLNGKYYLAKWNRSDLTSVTKTYICDSGKPTYDTYFGGAYFVQDLNDTWNGDIYLAREATGIWYVEKWNYNGTSFSNVEEIDQLESTAAGLSLTRPEPPKGSMNGGLKVIYQKGDYDESYETWDNELIGVI